MPNTRRAFLAMPFRPELRWVREAIRRAAQELSISLRAVDETLAPGDEIIAGVRQEIRECSFAYVVLSDLNPNVMYELGLLHEASKPTVLLADRDTLAHLPFDIKTRMVIAFERREEAAAELTRAVITATGRLLALFDPKARQEILSLPSAGPSPTVQGGCNSRSRSTTGRRLRTTVLARLEERDVRRTTSPRTTMVTLRVGD